MFFVDFSQFVFQRQAHDEDSLYMNAEVESVSERPWLNLHLTVRTSQQKKTSWLLCTRCAQRVCRVVKSSIPV